MDDKLDIFYYSDVLCIWAWIAQRKNDQLIEDFAGKIELHYLYVDVFGNTTRKIESQWQDKGGYAGFCQHVLQAADKFEHAPVNEKIWSEVRPATSANAHLILKAVEIVHDSLHSQKAALAIRTAFFSQAQDIGDIGILTQLLVELKIDVPKVQKLIANGSAMASLMGDYQQAKTQLIKGSPSYVLDQGRQILYGNVGYRVLRSNVEELLAHPKNEASWC